VSAYIESGVLSSSRELMNEMSGGCKCGQISFSVNGSALQIVTCHCGMCRSLTGAVFSTYVVVREEQFTLIEGRDQMASYAVTDRTSRHFCPTCGTPLFNSNPVTYKGLRIVYIGTIHGDQQLEPGINIFCESKLPWVTVRELSKSFQRTPGRDA
jgi:hypothetical protein